MRVYGSKNEVHGFHNENVSRAAASALGVSVVIALQIVHLLIKINSRANVVKLRSWCLTRKTTLPFNWVYLSVI